MPMNVFNSRNFIDVHSSLSIQCLQTKTIIDIELGEKSLIAHVYFRYSTYFLRLIRLHYQFIVIETKMTAGYWRVCEVVSLWLWTDPDLDCQGVMTPSSGPPIRTNCSTVMKFDLYSG